MLLVLMPNGQQEGEVDSSYQAYSEGKRRKLDKLLQKYEVTFLKIKGLQIASIEVN